MKVEDVYKLLEERGYWYEVTHHGEVNHMEDLDEMDIPYPQANAKNLFVRDKKKRNYFLITLAGKKRMDLKAFRQNHGTTALGFASDDDLKNILDLEPGAVTPLGLLQDLEKKVTFYLDQYFLEGDGIIAVHPMDNRVTVWMKTKDLIHLLEEEGHEVRMENFED